MKNRKLLFILTTFLAFYSGYVSANIIFSVNVHEIKETPEKDNNKMKKEETDYELDVEIGDSFFMYTQNDTKHIYDFAGRKIYTIDALKKQYSDESMFSDIGFREYEFQNRLELGGIFGAAAIKNNPMLPAFSEHLFSLRQGDKKSELERKTKKGLVIYSVDDHELLSYSEEGQKVSAENMQMFTRFFRYVFGGHPQILDELAFLNILPRTIQIRQYNIVNKNSKLSVSSITTTPSKKFSLEESTLKINDPDAFLKILNEVRYSKTIDFEKYLQGLISEASNHFKDGNYLDAMLAYFEYNLASGRGLPPSFEEQKALILQNEDVILLATSLSPKNKEEAEKCLSILQELEKKTKTRQEILKIFEADTLMGLHKTNEAEKLFHKIITARPYIAGVYKDLGDLYYGAYDAVMAWRCWDAARNIAPKHKMLIQINEFESKLVKDHPEFF